MQIEVMVAMVVKTLKKMEVSLGFIHIPVQHRAELIGDSAVPFETKLNGVAAKVDKFGRLWSDYLKNRFTVNTQIIISKNNGGFQILANERKNYNFEPETKSPNAFVPLAAEVPPAADSGKKLKIGFVKTCDCDSRHISCITAKEWVKSQVAIQQFPITNDEIKEFYYEGRDIRDKDVHPAVFPIALPAHFIKTLTHRGELVLDPFVGIGSTLLAAQDLGRNAVGFDLKEEYIEISRKRLGQKKILDDGTQQIAILDDAHNIPAYLEENTVSLCITSPPYANMLAHRRLNKSIRGDLRKNSHYLKVQQYSNNPSDLGTMNHEGYSKAIQEIYSGILPLMRKRAHCIINVNDVWENNKRIPTHVYILGALQKAGFEFRNTFIWDKRNLVNRVGIFGWPSNFISLGATMEFILDFWKP
ncbi:MAG: site-specific DNA-methyltransferase [Candidatus Bathyarchaeota archaeon]|nr:site-specific DNA-methyltransferase [Candidatus Bathyarchaeota archaeon]